MNRSEDDFIAAIDCRFPYGNPTQAERLIDEACSLSSNAAFMVAHELARRPQGANVSPEVCLSLLHRLDQSFTHPLKELVVGLVRRMILGELVPVAESLAAMRRIRGFPGQFNALAVACCACEHDGSELADAVYECVVDDWRRAQDPASPR